MTDDVTAGDVVSEIIVEIRAAEGGNARVGWRGSVQGEEAFRCADTMETWRASLPGVEQ